MGGGVRVVVATYSGALCRPVDEVYLGGAKLRDNVFKSITVSTVLCVRGRRVGIAEQRRSHQEEVGIGVVCPDGLNEFDISGFKGSYVDGIPHSKVVKVVGANIDNDGVRRCIHGESVAIVRIALTVAGPDFRDQWARVRLIVTRQADTAISNNTVGCVKGLSSERAIGLRVVLESGGVCAGGSRAVEAVADSNGVSDNLNFSRRRDIRAERPVGGNIGNGNCAQRSLGTFT